MERERDARRVFDDEEKEGTVNTQNKRLEIQSLRSSYLEKHFTYFHIYYRYLVRCLLYVSFIRIFV